MELDAAIMDHLKRYGAVMALSDIMNPISVARTIMEKCPHNVLCGEGALKWAKLQGFVAKTNIIKEEYSKEYEQWKYQSPSNLEVNKSQETKNDSINNEESHDTIGLICLDTNGNLCVGTSTSGWKFKFPGRIGDSPMIGSGLYCDGTVGAAVSTGDGEEVFAMKIHINILF